MSSKTNPQASDSRVVSVRTEDGTVVEDPDQPSTIESYEELTLALSDGREVTIEKEDDIIDSNGVYIGRVHSLRHLGGMDGWGYAVYIEYPEENGRDFGRSEGTRLGDVIDWFETRSQTTAC